MLMCYHDSPRSLRVGPLEIAAALKQFKIEASDYFLEFTEDTVYLHWVASRDQVQGYIDECLECMDVKIYNHWIDTYGTYECGMTILLPEQDVFTCRYILETI
jgi:hypothetical protein